MSCVFCKIARGELPAYVVYEDPETLAFLDLYPMTDGHTLVIPKLHAERLSELPPELAGTLFQTVQKVSERIARALGAPALNIGFNDGRAAGQAVPHLHVHIIPRFPGDGGGSFHSILHKPTTRPLDEIHRLIARTP
ncbi:MAG: HIT family protein [Candidatus Bipolaricaulota bacterium]|nr:HIT family protein [Candidatus Bipolaricaulota bacterium]